MCTELEQEQIALYLARRSYVYHLLHIVFGAQPNVANTSQVYSSESQEMIRSFASCSAELEDALNEVALKSELLDMDTIDVMRSDFMRLFQVPGMYYVHPWESPYTSSNKLLMQGSTLEVRDFYHKAGFQLKAERHFPDDHIAAMMDYMARQSERVYEAYADGHDDEVTSLLSTQILFAHEHILNWVELFADKLAINGSDTIYAPWACVLVEFIRSDMKEALNVQASL